jgi:hypothetical protein
MMISRQFLDQSGYDRTAVEALMESYGSVWPDIHDRAINNAMGPPPPRMISNDGHFW